MHSKRFLVRRTVAVAAAGAAALVLVACGGDRDGDGGKAASTSAARSTYGAADVAFAKGMIPHHRQAVEMAGLAAGRAQSPEVKKLAADIEKAQGPEIETLSGWLASWGEEVPAPGAMDHSAHGDMQGMEGMMSGEEMGRLQDSSGSAFDTAFLRMMIEHHKGAVAMAETEQADGTYAPAKAMAGDIITSQTAEITRMSALLGQD
ncbi:DUF305 domain-containing protein [Streptomyces antibioticus]|uniref:DUF305 domain-containing protein n=1 Tax=Streptomyces antibioticus TaxID=1890 RepID=UPI0037B8ECAF